MWLERKVRQRLDALQPDHALHVASERARSAGRTVVEAVAEGRDAMRPREQELLARRDGTGGPDLRLVPGSGGSSGTARR
mgnify:CR=1 FL=1